MNTQAIMERPINDKVIIEKSDIRLIAPTGALTAAQCIFFGLEYPAKSGWKDHIIGTVTTLKDYGILLAMKRKKKKNREPSNVDVKTDAFLMSFEWRKLRLIALKACGARCQCCGASPKKNGVVLNVDHIKSRKKYPELALVLENLQVLCEPCNHGKGNWDETDWR
jgi:hypothetical protein